jgi:hypothetical protein
MAYEWEFAIALFITLAIEVPVAIALVKLAYKRRDIAASRIAGAGILASALTLPYLWFVLPALALPRGLYAMLGEVLVVLVEALLYRMMLGLKFADALLISAIANAASAAAGLAL